MTHINENTMNFYFPINSGKHSKLCAIGTSLTPYNGSKSSSRNIVLVSVRPGTYVTRKPRRHVIVDEDYVNST